MGTNHLGVFYDGIEIGNAQNGTVDLGKFSMDNIEELALYNGQKSEIFQPAKDYGSAGTLYIKMRRPKFNDGKRFNLSLTMKAGTFGLANPSILYEQKIVAGRQIIEHVRPLAAYDRCVVMLNHRFIRVCKRHRGADGVHRYGYIGCIYRRKCRQHDA